jgi:tRNA 2-thiouridine synthesizing protein A
VTDQIRADEYLDLTGIVCPINTARALLRLARMPDGAVLELRIDDGEPSRNVPSALIDEGHEILDMTPLAKQWRVMVRARS